MALREVPVSSLSPQKYSQLQAATIVPRMYIYIEGYELDPKQDAIVYDIEIGIQKQQVVKVINVKRRYSALQAFDATVRPLFSDSRFLQRFPPKKVFGNKKEAFLKDRAEKLQRYLTNLVRVSGIVQAPAFLRCFDIDADWLSDV